MKHARLALAAIVVVVAGQSAAYADSLLEAAQRGDSEAAIGALTEGASVAATQADGTTALHWAVYNGDVELVRRLIATGTDVAASNDYGSTPMAEAAVRADVDILASLLAAGGDPDSPNADGQTVLMVVARTDNLAAAELLLEHGADINAVEQRKQQTALMWAAAQGQTGMVELLLAHGAEIEARSKINVWERRVTAEPRVKDITPGGFTPLLFAAREGCLGCVRALVSAGADLHKTNPDTISPLLMALLNAQFDTAEYLVASGADVNQWDRWGRTPLYAAVDYNTLPIGGRPDRPSMSTLSGLDMIDILLAAGANPNAQLKLFPPYRSLRADRGADQILGIGTTPLIRAARAGDTAAIERLLAHGALADLPQAGGVTPLMAAATMDRRSTDTRGKFTLEGELLAAARALLAAGADVGRTDNRGRTALHAAASQGLSGMVRLLAEHGADLNAADSGGFLPLDNARGQMAGARGPGEVHAETAEIITGLMRTTATQ